MCHQAADCRPSMAWHGLLCSRKTERGAHPRPPSPPGWAAAPRCPCRRSRRAPRSARRGSPAGRAASPTAARCRRQVARQSGLRHILKREVHRRSQRWAVLRKQGDSGGQAGSGRCARWQDRMRRRHAVPTVDEGCGGARRGVQEVSIHHGARALGGQDPHILLGGEGPHQAEALMAAAGWDINWAHALCAASLAGPQRWQCCHEARLTGGQARRAPDLQPRRLQPPLQPAGCGQEVAVILRQRRHRGDGSQLQQVPVVSLLALGPAGEERAS